MAEQEPNPISGSVTDPPATAEVAEGQRQQLAFALRRELGDAAVRFDPGSRHLYATDASNYRHLPAGVVVPRYLDDIEATVRLCREHDVPLTSRGAGTSLAGQATNTGVILDLSRHIDRILEVDANTRSARVQPGVVLDSLQRAAAPHALRFGPDPSTHDRCTMGGMIGNDACGAHSIVHGRTMHQVRELNVLLADGTRMRVGRHSVAEVERWAARGGRIGALADGLLRLRADVGDAMRERFPDLPRRVSGYHLDQLLHDDHLDVAKALVGTEGTCVLVLDATVALVDRPAATAVVVLGYPDLASAADHAPELVSSPHVVALEGIDAEVVAGAGRPRRPRPPGLDLLPSGEAWAIAEVVGDTPRDAWANAEALAAEQRHRLDGPVARVVADPAAQRAVWAVRAEGLGAVMVAPGRTPKIGGWEDAAVPPARLGAYLRDLGGLLREHGMSAAVYGHLGDGCVHTKIDFDHTTAEGRTTFRRFVEDACELVIAHGGSPSGEHGDGQARAELYDRVFGPELVDAFRRFKGLWDPDGLLNPGRVVDPLPLDVGLRTAALPAMSTPAGWFALSDDGGDLARAASRCVGVGSCLRDQGTGTMCPSYMVTHDEQHSTRGRAHLLFELLRPDSDLDGFDDDAVADALDLCLSCKACKTECPTGVDVATTKAEVLARRYENRRRPLDHHVLGRVRWWLRAASRAPGLANALARSPLSVVGRRLAGVTTQRPVPAIAAEPFSAWWRRRGSTPHAGAEPVLLFVDTFTETLTPSVGRAAVAVLESSGHRVTVAPEPVCCGRPLYDHGMLDQAVTTLRRLVRVLAPAAHGGVPIVGLEPSCVAALRDELPELLHEAAVGPAVARDARAVAAATRSFAEHLVATGWEPTGEGDAGDDAEAPEPDEVLVQTHCHQGAVWGRTADATILDTAGIAWRDLDAGCCGLAGSFGYRDGEPYELSVAAAERKLLPALRDAGSGTALLADGYSCRTQVQQLLGDAAPPTLHLAELLAARLRSAPAAAAHARPSR